MWLEDPMIAALLGAAVGALFSSVGGFLSSNWIWNRQCRNQLRLIIQLKRAFDRKLSTEIGIANVKAEDTGIDRASFEHAILTSYFHFDSFMAGVADLSAEWQLDFPKAADKFLAVAPIFRHANRCHDARTDYDLLLRLLAHAHKILNEFDDVAVEELGERSWFAVDWGRMEGSKKKIRQTREEQTEMIRQTMAEFTSDGRKR